MLKRVTDSRYSIRKCAAIARFKTLKGTTIRHFLMSKKTKQNFVNRYTKGGSDKITVWTGRGYGGAIRFPSRKIKASRSLRSLCL